MKVAKNGVGTNRIAAKLEPEHPQERISIPEPQMKTVAFKITGTSPLVQNKFSKKAREQMKATQEAGATAKRKRKPKDFQQCFEEAQYQPSDGRWECGAIPATAFRAAMIAACDKENGIPMTVGKKNIFVEADGYDKDEMKPLVRITKGRPKYFEQPVRNANGSADIRARPAWDPGWEAVLRISYNAAILTASDVANLLMHAGMRIGIQEGRYASRDCVGIGWGCFKIVN